MSRSDLKELLRQRREQEEANAPPADFWPELCQRVADGQVIPIVSNSVVNDLIFAALLDADDANPLRWNAEDSLSDLWAEDVQFPLPERQLLPRVALYVRVVKTKTVREAKSRYLNFLKDSLLVLAEQDGADAVTLDDLRRPELGFADAAVELGYPRPVPNQLSPLETLAKLRLPIYITTSHYDFLERAIRADHREPRTQICFWAGEPNKYVDPSHKTDPNFQPSVETPLVYHIFGLESYIESMVLNEDDYLDFLRNVARDAAGSNRILPAYLTEAVAKSSLLLLGYRLRDLEFRVMFRALIPPSGLRDFNVALQMDLRQQSQSDTARQIKEYLTKYFGEDFAVSYDSLPDFITNLWNKCRHGGTTPG